MRETAAFCPNCGTSMNASFGRQQEGYSHTIYGQPSPASPYATAGALNAVAVMPAEEKSKRVLGYLIDLVPMLFLSLLHLIPIAGWMFYGLLHVCYWLLRDINGASLGRSALGSFVGDENGGPSTTSQRIVRNIPLALPGLLGLVPLVGLPFEFTAALLVFLGEAVLLLATGRRFGDRMARTNVFRRSV